MSDDTAGLLSRLLDERAIVATMIHYADRIDANDPEGAAACFTVDGVGHYWGEHHGRDAIAERLRGILTRFTATSHHLSNPAIEVDGDRARATSYVYAFHRLAGTDEPMHYWGRWVDELARVDGAWLFTERRVVGVGAISPGNPPADLHQPGHPGRLAHR